MSKKEEEIVNLLKELVKWTKVTSIPHVKEILVDTLKKPEERIAYQLSDGRRTVTNVAKRAKVSTGTISGWWKKWEKVGIAEPITVMGGTRAKHGFILEDFGIEVPEIVKSSAPINGGKNSDKQDSDGTTS